MYMNISVNIFFLNIDDTHCLYLFPVSFCLTVTASVSKPASSDVPPPSRTSLIASSHFTFMCARDLTPAQLVNIKT